MTELMAPSTSLRSATYGGRDLDLKGAAARLPHVDSARELIRAGTATGSLNVVAAVDRVAGAVGVFLVLVFGIYVLVLG